MLAGLVAAGCGPIIHAGPHVAVFAARALEVAVRVAPPMSALPTLPDSSREAGSRSGSALACGDGCFHVVLTGPSRYGAWRSAADPPEEAPRTFDPAAARGALTAVDPSSCWAPQAVHGYVKTTVTFEPGGTVKRVAVGGSGVPQPDAACIHAKLGAATVAPFRGPEIAVPATFYVQ